MMKMHLPSPLTPLLGRERELADIQRLLVTARLVTLTGPGGVGKTRLALQVARDARETFVDGVHFISLAAIRDSALILPTLAQALGLAEYPDRLLFDSLKDFLRNRQALLVLDNFEQVISAGPLLTELLAACADLCLLVTSREALRVRGEQEFPLAPLALSDRSQWPDPRLVETLLHYPAIAVFVERAQATQPEFTLTADNAAVVAEICARLDGLPLALELAAARIKLLPPQAMLTQLQESPLDWLSGGSRDAPARHQTLRATMQWSYTLLNADEQRAFRRLAVFVDGCTLAPAIEVISQSLSMTRGKGHDMDHGPPTPLDLVASLVNKSLVRQTASDGEPRLSMLETIREFGLEQLALENEREAVEHAHAQSYLSLAEEAEPHLIGREQKKWLHMLAREQANLRAVLRWGFDRQQAEFALRLASALWKYWHLRGQWSEGRRWLDEALSIASKADVNTALRARVLYAAATLIRQQYDFSRARALCEQSITLYRALDNKEGQLTALLELCRILDYQGEDKAVRALAPEALALAEELPDVAIKAEVYAGLPLLQRGSIDSGTATRYLAESERIHRTLDNPAGLAYTLFLQGAVADMSGDLARGQALREEGERLAAEVDDQRLRLVLLSGRILSAWQSGDATSARSYIEQTFAARREVDASTGQTKLVVPGQRHLLLGILAAVLHGQGLSVWAARVYGLADRLATSSESPRMGGELFDALRQRVAATRAEVQAELGDAAFAQALAEGQAMHVEDLLAIPHPSLSDSTSHAQPASASAPYEPLTPREFEVLRLLAQDLGNTKIAERLVVSRRTVDAHLRSIYAKLGVKSREAALRVARDYGLI